MASGVLPRPGSQYGPCLGECHHIDCVTIRLEAGSLCRFCGKKIDYAVEFYREEAGLVHARCLEISTMLTWQELTPAQQQQADAIFDPRLSGDQVNYLYELTAGVAMNTDPSDRACSLCGRTVEVKSDYLRCVRKRDRRLMRGYFQPRLSPDELHALPDREAWVCTNRQACRRRSWNTRHSTF